MFHVGQKVVCVDDDFFVGPHPDLKQGQVYEILRIHKDRDLLGPSIGRHGDCGLSFDLVGVREKYVWPCNVCFTDSFGATRFRPVAQKPTDISIFKAILNSPHKERETA